MKTKIILGTLFAFLCLNSIYSQVTNNSNVALTTGPSEYVGYDGSGTNNRSLDLKNLFGNYNINFWTNNNTSTLQKMTILGSSTSNDGFVGIGTSFTPKYKLDVDAGDINLNTYTNAYRIGDGSTNPSQSYKVLWHNGIISSIYVGVGAGNTNASTNNTFVGYNCGNATTASGSNNTLIGYSAGGVTTSGEKNIFVGSAAGISNTTGSNNIFIGFEAAHDNTTGSWNTIITLGGILSEAGFRLI